MKSVPVRRMLWLPVLTLLLMLVGTRLPRSPLQAWIVRAPLPELLGWAVLLTCFSFILENQAFNSWVLSGLVDSQSGADSADSDPAMNQSSADDIDGNNTLPTSPGIAEPGLLHRNDALSERIWLPLGLVFLVGCLVFLERMQSFYFTQDDNLVQFLPTILQSSRSLWQGIFPTVNPYQFLGSPTASLGTYALTYPPTYFSYWVARTLLHNEYLTCEVFCVTHLIAGYFTGYWACREARVGRALSATGSLCLALSGFILMAGRSWYYMTPVVFWSPLFVISTVRLQRGRTGWKWALGTGLLIGVYFHAGNAQMWIYAVLFWALSIALLKIFGGIPRPSLGWTFAAVGLGIGIVSPLLVPQALVTAHVFRPQGYEWTLEDRVLSLLLPIPLDQVDHLFSAHTLGRVQFWQLFYSGTLFYAASFWAVGALVLYGFRRRLIADNIWLVCAVVAFLFAMGPSGILWPLFYMAPPFDKFQHPVKFVAFLNLFVVIGGGKVIQRYLDHSTRKKLGERALFFVVCGLLAFHCSLSRTAWYWYGDKPYPPLPAPMARLLLPAGASLSNGAGPSTALFWTGGAQGRVFSFAPKRSPMPGFANALNQNYPSVKGISAFAGYDPLVDNSVEFLRLKLRLRADPVGTARAFGVRWLVVHWKVYGAAHNPEMAMKDWETADPEQLAEFKAMERQA
ncbi:MAG: hypothetical protein M3Y56_04895, partial [Armatimonadota bacterium]|nr:hypothetical protein [Armatimonadota bacterium]